MRMLLLFALFSVTKALAAGDPAPWPRWRGPSDNGSIAQGAYPLKWDAKHVKWKTPLPGKGCSTPIVLGRQIFLTAPVDGQDAALAFDWEGKELWRKSLGPEQVGKRQNSSGCNPSPATDGTILTHAVRRTMKGIAAKATRASWGFAVPFAHVTAR